MYWSSNSKIEENVVISMEKGVIPVFSNWSVLQHDL